MIEVYELTKQYAGRTAIDQLTFRVQPGEIVGFLGPNGAGKSTTMRILSGYMPPTSGRATVNGYDVFRESLEARKSVGYMPENAPLYMEMRVKEYLSFRASLKGLHGQSLKSEMNDVMELCSLTDVRRRLIGNLSKGFRQRVALADALLNRPPLLILDEPTNGLDPVQIRQIRELLLKRKEESTILLSTHILQEVDAICDRIILIHKGKLRAVGRPQELAKNLRSLTLIVMELNLCGKDYQCLNEINGVRKIIVEPSETEWQNFKIYTESQVDLREKLTEVARQKGIKVREVFQKLPNLEDVFVELTQRDDF
jgi:ABC-2 type transport system ATP-binding protein